MSKPEQTSMITKEDDEKTTSSAALPLTACVL